MQKRLELTPQQAGDLESVTETAYSEAADTILEAERGLSIDLVALVAIFLTVVTYHIQNPLLQFVAQFGRAFRNESLQVVLAVTLVICVVILTRAAAGARRTKRLPPHLSALQVAAVVVLAVYCVYIASAVLVRFNPLGAAFGVPQEVFLDEVEDEALIAQLQTPLVISTVMEYLAIAAIVVLWQPWQRLTGYQRSLRRQSAALLVAVAVLVLWESLINLLNIQQFLLPRPSVIGTTFMDVYPRLVSAGWTTFQNAFWGFAIGCGAGIVIGMISARFISFSRALLPVAVALNAVPIIALAPITNNWFGTLNPGSKIAIVAIMTFFPAMISTIRGLTSVEPLSLELMKSYAASQWEIFAKLRLPSALPYIFSALKVATTLAMIGAIVGEYFGGSTAGLGYRIRDDSSLFRYAEAWSAILIASLFGILFYLVVSAVERALMSWHVSFREK
jgi:NitT/TauT family transport system permease protein